MQTSQKILLVVALPLAVIFDAGLVDTMFGLSITFSTYVCGGSGIGSGSGGGC